MDLPADLEHHWQPEGARHDASAVQKPQKIVPLNFVALQPGDALTVGRLAPVETQPA